ncbi:MAG TPA: hypothetical protein G4O13_05190 [Dehalococcoidia bacterium]|nr:hypothetical protein [Dehalococcoidia bacterium]
MLDAWKYNGDWYSQRIEKARLRRTVSMKFELKGLVNDISRADRKKIAIAVLIVMVVAAFIVIGMPAVLRSMAVGAGIMEDTAETAVPADGYVSLIVGIGLAILAATLGGIVSWLGRSRPGASLFAEERPDDETMKNLGKAFLFAALLLALFTVLVPLMPEVKVKSDFWSTAVRWTAAITLIWGSVVLSCSILYGIFEIMFRFARGVRG